MVYRNTEKRSFSLVMAGGCEKMNEERKFKKGVNRNDHQVAAMMEDGRTDNGENSADVRAEQGLLSCLELYLKFRF